MLDVLLEIAGKSWQVLGEMAPYLLVGFGVAGILSVLVSPETVERHLGGGGLWPVVKATLFGIPLPLCSCGVIPVAASLRRHGATRGATASFLLSTPQTGVDSIMVTLGLLGPAFAIFRPVVALITGLVGGSIVAAADRHDGANISGTERCQDACCTDRESGNRAVRAIRYAFVSLPQDIGRALLVGILIAGLISALMPGDFLAGVIGTGIGAMLVMIALGMPVYVCATASVPVAAALIVKGVTPGAAFVFLMTGPATNAAAIATVWKIMGRRTALIYMGTVAVCALLAGVALDSVLSANGLAVQASMGWMLPGYAKTASAVLLLATLAIALLRGGHATHEHGAALGDSEQATTLTIGGMTCTHCRDSVRRALMECEGVDSVQVDLKSGVATVAGEGLATESLAAAVDSLGYTARLHE